MYFVLEDKKMHLFPMAKPFGQVSGLFQMLSWKFLLHF